MLYRIVIFDIRVRIFFRGRRFLPLCLVLISGLSLQMNTVSFKKILNPCKASIDKLIFHIGQ